MRKIVLFLFLSGCAVFLFGQQTNNNEIVEAWKLEHKYGTIVYQFNPDGTYTMSSNGKEVREALEREQGEGIGEKIDSSEYSTGSGGENETTTVHGTYTLTPKIINLVMAIGKRSGRIRISYRKIDGDTLQMQGATYKRVVETDEEDNVINYWRRVK